MSTGVIGNIVIGMQANTTGLTKGIKQAETALKQMGLQGAASQLTKFASATNIAGLALAGIGETINLAKAGFSATVGEAMTVETAMVGLAKASDLNGDSLTKLKDDLFALSTELKGVKVEDLFTIATAGAKLGIASNDIVEYTKGIAMLSTAIDDMPAAEMADEVGKINEVFKLGVKGAMQLGSAIDKVADSGIAASKYIFDVTQRISGSAKAMNLAAPEAIALAGALLDTGTNAEAGGGAIIRLLNAMVRVKNHAEFAKAASMDVKEFSKLVEKDPIEAIQAFLGALKKMSANEQLEALGEVGIKANKGAAEVQKLAQKTESISKYAAMANSEFETLNQITQSYEKSATTAAAQWIAMDNAIKQIGNSVGEEVLPGLKVLLSTTTELLTMFKRAKGEVSVIGTMLGAAAGPLGVFFSVQSAVAKSKAVGPLNVPAGGGEGEALFAPFGPKKKTKEEEEEEEKKAKAQAKTKKAVDEYTASLQAEIATFGMSTHAAEAYKLSLKGATAEQIASATAVANQLDQMEQTKKIQEMNNEFMEQAYLVGMLPKEIAVYKAFLAGATAEQAKFAGSLAEQADNMEKAKEVTEANMTPLETYTKKLKELDALKASGSISQETYDRAKTKAKSEYESEALPSTPFASAMEQGSAEARSTVLNFQASGMMSLDDPAKETAKNTQKQVEQGDAMLGLLGKLVDKGLAKANDLADAGIGQLLGFQ